MTKFRDGFMMKSPLGAHGKELKDEAMKLSKESSGRDDAPDYDNPKVVKLLEDAKKAEAEHDSPAKMSPFQGYVDGEERVSHYQPTADLYQGLVDTLTSNVDKIASSKKGKEKDSFKKAGKRVRKIKDTGVGYEFGKTLNDGLNLNDGVNSHLGKYAVGDKAEKENAFQKYSS